MSVRARLCVMMFLEYFVWGSWGVSLGGYMGSTLGFDGVSIGAVYSSTAIAAIFSPLVFGYVADRLMATERLLAILHFVGAGLLYYAASVTEYSQLFPVMILYALLFMPTLALTNSISFENIVDPEKEFPLIRVFGTLSWISAGLVVGFILQAPPKSAVHDWLVGAFGSDPLILQPNSFFYLAAGTSVLLAVFCLFLPHTPPKGKTPATETAGRSGILHLLAEPSFLVFVIASFLICIPLAFYYNFANLFLVQTDAPAPTALQTIGQMSEVFFMAVMPWFILRLGVKKMLAVGMAAWVVRYLCFGSSNFPLIVLGLLLHGICYDFFFVASQIYVDSKADVTQRARAQSFIAFVTLGLGMFIGAYVAGWTYNHYPPPVRVALEENGKTEEVPLPDWDLKAETGLAAALKLAPDAQLAPDELPESITGQVGQAEYTYPKADLAAAILAADKRFGNGDGRISRAEWRQAQANDWFHIWLWPALAAGGTLLFFWIGFRDKPRTQS